MTNIIKKLTNNKPNETVDNCKKRSRKEDEEISTEDEEISTEDEEISTEDEKISRDRKKSREENKIISIEELEIKYINYLLKKETKYIISSIEMNNILDSDIIMNNINKIESNTKLLNEIKEIVNNY